MHVVIVGDEPPPPLGSVMILVLPIERKAQF